MAGKHKISKKKIILILLACLITVLIIGTSVMVARGELYVRIHDEGGTMEFFQVTKTEDPNPPEKFKFNVDTESSRKQYYRIFDSYKDKNTAVTATVGPTYLNNSSRSLYDGVLHFDHSRLMLGTIFQTSGRQNYTNLFVKNDEGTPESIYMASIEFAKIPGASNADVAKNLYLISEGKWVNSYTKQQTKSNATHQIFIFRYANGDLSTGAGQNTRVGWDGKNCEGTHVDLADYKYKYIIFNPFVYNIKADKGFTDTDKTSVVIKRWGLENVYDQIVDRESKVGEDFIGWSVKNSSSGKYVFGTTATTGLKAADMKKYLDGNCFQEAAFANLYFTALYEEEPPTTTETETEPSTKKYKVITNYFYFRSDKSWDIVISDPIYLEEWDYYEIPAPHVDGYDDPLVGYYNPHIQPPSDETFVEKPGETICDWMVNNDCITFSVIYQQPFEVTAKHFTWIGGELIYQDEWDNVRLVAKGRTYEVDMTSRGPFDVIKAGKFTGDYSNPVTEEQYAFTVNENMTVALIYQKVNADYKVEHYKQNIADDNYTLIDTDKKMGNVGAEPEYEYKNYTGFTKNTSKAVIPSAISEDDSTVVKLYYDRNVHAVALDKGTGIQSVTGAGAYRYGQTVNISASTEAGYNWVKWTGTEGVLSDMSEASASFTMPDRNVSLTANAEPKQFRVTFMGNAGTVSTPEMTVTYDSKDGNTNAVTAVRDLYELGGWYTERNETGATPLGELVFDKDGNAVKGSYWSDNGSSAVWKGLSNLTVYAYWDFSKNTLYFDYNVPDDADIRTLSGDDIKDKQITYTKPYGDLPEPELAGYEFEGWFLDKSSSPQITAETIHDTPTDIKVYAHWTPVRYSIDYVLNGGTLGADYPTEALYGSTFNVSNPTRGIAYDFAGWDITGMDNCTHTLGSTTSTATSESGIKDTSFKNLRSTDGIVIFTAKWTPVTFSIKYNLNGAADPGNPSSYTAETPTFPLNNPSKEGYKFINWTGTGLKPEGEYYVTIPTGSTGDREYTAHFIANSYKIEYVLDGGTAGTYAPDEAVYDSTITISNPTKPGAVFEGWDITGMDSCTHTLGTATTTDSSASGIKATSYKNLRSTYETVTFTAKWKYISYNITYDFNGGRAADFGSYPASVQTWNEFTVTTPVHDNGFNFLGWTITGMDNGEHRYGGYTSNDSTLAGIKETEYENLRYSSGTVKFTAAWERPVRQIVFMSDDGEMTGDSVQDGWTMRFIRFGDKLFTATNEYGISWGTDVPRADKTGYSFLGYYDSIDGGNQLYTGAYTKSPGLYWDTDGRWIGPSLIIYAQYTPRKYKVYYNLNGGVWADDSSSGERDVTVTYDSTDYNKYYGESDVYRKGYIFEGWYDAVTGGEKVYAPDGSCIGGNWWSTDYVE